MATSGPPTGLHSPKEGALKAISTSYHARLHAYAIFLAVITLFLIVAGALVTSNEAGLSVPDWPTTFGSVFHMPRMVGGVLFEHGHRMVAEFVGFNTIILAFWTWIADKRRWLRFLAIGALATVIIQGVLGGLTVLNFLPPAISSAHAAMAQTFFCIAVCIALFTGRNWIEEVPRVEPEVHRPRLFTLTVLSILVLYVQLILGAMFRHRGLSWWPHVVHAAVVAIVLTWTSVRAISQYSRIPPVKRPAILMLSLLIAQLCLGFAAFLTKVVWAADAPQPEQPMVVATVTHVAVGALLLATAVVLAIQVWRYVPVTFEERVPSGERNPLTA